ncbi:MAG TPA: PLD nuclease N-terminal domain-containing protein [Longimicrobiales bacterium]|nr:PLD nuclease N-terminal domain-containing protein [Longimicrobiales bacterium]
MDFVLPLLILVLNLWALMEVLGSDAPTGRKLLWTLFVVLLPGIGVVAWLFRGPRRSSKEMNRVPS